MKRLYLLLALTIFALPVLACKCAHPLILRDLSQLDAYTFIALVTITDDGDQAGSNTLQFTVVEMFKGVSRSYIIESGKGTSCDMDIVKGQEWLLFGTLTDGKLYISRCSFSTTYRNEKGEINWNYDETPNPLQTLRVLFKKPLPFHKDGPQISYYKNGQKEIEESYLNGRLHGERITWYADGQLRTKEGYLNGLKEGKFERYFTKGILFEDRFYKAGKDWNIQRIYFGDSLEAGVKKGPVHFETIYDANGEYIASREYYRSGQIKWDSFKSGKDGQGIDIDYHPNGVVKFIQHWKKGKPTEHYQRYDENGIAIKSENWIKETGLRESPPFPTKMVK